MCSQSLINELRSFMEEREWTQFHTPENLAKSISIESAELLECFQWSAEGNGDEAVEELADVLTYCLLMADRLGVEPQSIVREKLAKTAAKYPVEKARGKSTKYDQL